MRREWPGPSPVRGPLVLAAMLVGCCGVVRAGTPGHSSRLAAAASATPGTVTVQARTVAKVFLAYGQVQPIAPLPVRALASGVIAHLSVVPGSRVQPGEALVTLSGPEIRSLLVNRQGALRSARSRLAAARRDLAIERRQLSGQLSTQQDVVAAQSAVAAAKAAFDTAQVQLNLAEETQTLRAPSAGAVLAVNAAAGERVVAGQTVLTLQNDSRLWLRAVYYGADAAAIRVGMTGQFRSGSGGAVVPVKVVAIAAALAPDGGESVGLVPIHPHGQGGRAAGRPWSNGARGSVSLTGPTRHLVVVPTRALVLDRARWWVLVRTPKGMHRQVVVPGPTRGWDTFIEQGLSPGEQVVVENAYLEFHRGIARRYTPPD